MCLGINCVWVTGHASGALAGGTKRDAHGRLSAFQAFQSPDVAVLVSTATAEEGVDVSSVCVVLVENGSAWGFNDCALTSQGCYCHLL